MTKDCYHPGRSGSINLKSSKGPQLATFGEIHPAIIKKMDFKDKNIFGLEIFLKNIPEPNKKIKETKKIMLCQTFRSLRETLLCNR